MSTAIQAREAGEISVGRMLETMIERGVTAENVAALKEMVQLHKEMLAMQAEKDFAAAFGELQKVIPKIKATTAVRAKDQSVKYRYAKLEEIDRQLRPKALEYGFTYWFEEGESAPDRITKVAVVQHVGGHKRSNSFTVRIGEGPPFSTDSQKDGSAHSYAKRGALCDAFCIIVEHMDNDAQMEGGEITAEQAADLRKRLRATGADEAAFLKFAGAKTYEEIKQGRYGEIDKAIRKKERTT